MRCLVCGKRLPLFRKVAGEFCSPAHELEYSTGQRQAALGRLEKAVEQDAKANALWEKQKRVKRGDLAPAGLQSSVRMKSPAPVVAQQFQRRVPSHLPYRAVLVIPEVRDLAAVRRKACEVPESSAVLALGADWLPWRNCPVVRAEIDPPQPSSWTPWIWRGRLDYRPEHVACPIHEPEAEGDLVASPEPHSRCGAKKMRRFYAQSTPFRIGRRPYVIPTAGLEPDPAASTSAGVDDPSPAGLIALSRIPGILDRPALPSPVESRPLRFPLRVIASGSVRRLPADLRTATRHMRLPAPAYRRSAPELLRVAPVRMQSLAAPRVARLPRALRLDVVRSEPASMAAGPVPPQAVSLVALAGRPMPGAEVPCAVHTAARVPKARLRLEAVRPAPSQALGGLVVAKPPVASNMTAAFVRVVPMRRQPPCEIAPGKGTSGPRALVLALARPAPWSPVAPLWVRATPLQAPLVEARSPIHIRPGAACLTIEVAAEVVVPPPPLAGKAAMEASPVAGVPGRLVSFDEYPPEGTPAKAPVSRLEPVRVDPPKTNAPAPKPRPRPAASFVEPKPQPAFPNKGETKRYAPVMMKAAAGAPAKPLPPRRREADPPMAPKTSLDGWVSRRGVLRVRSVPSEAYPARRTTAAGPLFYHPPAPLPVFGPSQPPRDGDLKHSGRFAERRNGSRLDLLAEVSAPPAFWKIALERWRDAPLMAKWGGVFIALLLAGFALPLPSSKQRTAPSEETAETMEADSATGTAAGAARPFKQKAAKAPRKQPARSAATSDTPPPAAKDKGLSTGAWANFKNGFSRRAAVNLADDFRAGLGDWSGDGNWSKGWAYDQAGFIRPGALGLFVPSITLSDYQMEFLGQIDRRALSWVVRAADQRNYQAVRLVVAEAGPVPKVVLERFAIVRGQAGPVKRAVIPFPVRNDTTYQVVTAVRDEKITVTIKDSLIDSWSEPRLRQGGAGFFAGRGEQARVRWMSVTHQNDFIGKVCAMIAPPRLGGE